jgi:hypothetical protein
MKERSIREVRDPKGLGKISRSVMELERDENSLILSCRPMMLFYVKDLSRK